MQHETDMILYEALFVYIKLRLALWKCLGYHNQNLAYRQFDVEYSSKWNAYITILAIGANQPRDVTRGGTARWRRPCSKSYNKTTFFL